RAEEKLGALVAHEPEPGESGYDNSIGALDALAEELYRPFGLARHLTAVMNSPELRAAFNEVQPEVVSFFARLSTDQRLWHVLERFSESYEASALTGVRRRHLQKTLAEFRREGADLPEAE